MLLIAGALRIFTAEAAPQVSTDKANYAPNETVTITGTGFDADGWYEVPVIRPDGTIDETDGASGTDEAQANASGMFVYSYKLNGISGEYRVEVYAKPWGGPGSGDTLLASTTFWDSPVQHHQYRNGATKGVNQGDEEWTKGNIGSANSSLSEGDSVAYRFEFDDVDAGAVIELVINYEFNKGTQYAFDFLTNVERTEGDAALC